MKPDDYFNQIPVKRIHAQGKSTRSGLLKIFSLAIPFSCLGKVYWHDGTCNAKCACSVFRTKVIGKLLETTHASAVRKTLDSLSIYLWSLCVQKLFAPVKFFTATYGVTTHTLRTGLDNKLGKSLPNQTLW